MDNCGTLAVALLNAQGLKDVEGVLGGRQDPYCVIQVGAKSYRSNTNTDGGKNPVWNQLFTFHNVTTKHELNIELYDENMVMRDTMIGTCNLPLNQVPLGMQPLDVRLPVYTKKGKQRGELALKLQFQPLNAGPPMIGNASMASTVNQTVNQSMNARNQSMAPPPPMNQQPPMNQSYNNRQPPAPGHVGTTSIRQQAGQASNQHYNNAYGGSNAHVSGHYNNSYNNVGQQPGSGQRNLANPTGTTSTRPSNPYNSRIGVMSKRYRPDIWVLPNYADTHCWEYYDKGAVLGKGTYGTTYLGTRKGTNEKYAIKVISKRKLSTPEEIGDVQREVKVMHHLKGHPNVVSLKDVFEDQTHICLVMELCTGGELFDTILKRGEFTEYDAASIMRPILSVVEHCHNMGVIHRDIKPENFLLANKGNGAPLKLTDFGLSTFFREGEKQSERVGSAYYVAPEVLRQAYGKEADIWSCGVILYILLCGEAPFQGVDEDDTIARVLDMPIQLTGGAWDVISDEAKDCVMRMLDRDPRRRASAVQLLKHDWMRENGCANDNPIEAEVFKRIKKFSGMNALRREALLVIAGNLPLDEISGLREMFLEIDVDRSGSITVEEFTAALQKKGQSINVNAAKQVMAAADVNGDGILDYEEFLAAMVNAGKLDREENLKLAFEQFDTDGSGYITRDELKLALQEKTKFSEAEIDTIIDEADKDGDGQIDYYEFVSMMRNM